MKFFVPTGVTGKAGEYYFAYWILRHFQWPCRILDIDVGIDAQVEVFEDGISTGNFFAVQIKSTIGSTPDIQISLSDFEYWQQIENNVILVSILFFENGKEPCIYWKYFSNDQLSIIINHAKSNNFSSKLIKFLDSDKLELESKAAWVDSLISESDNTMIRIATSLIEVIEKYNLYNFIEEDYEEQDLRKDYITFSQEIDEINSIFLDYEKLLDAAQYDRRLKIRAKVIGDALDISEKSKGSLLCMFDHAFDSIKEERVPEEILPRNLSKEIRYRTEDWIALFTSY